MTRSLKSQVFLPSALLLIFLYSFPNLALAQHYHAHTYQERDGLPTNPTFDATQDSQGRMWFCTRVGLTTYDGRSWQVHTFNPNASAQPQVLMEMDSRGSLWTISAHQPLRLSRRVDGRWTTLSFEPLTLRDFVIVGLEVLNLGDGSDRVAIIAHDGKVLIWDGKNFLIHHEREQTGPIVSTVLMGSRLFLATARGLFSLDLDHPSPTIQLVPNLPPGIINNIALASNAKSLWLVGLDWLGIWDGHHFSLLKENLVIIPPKNKTRTAALADRIGGLYFGGQRNIHYYHPETGLEVLNKRNGLVAGGATSFFQDREGSIWITSTRGISKIISRRFAGYNRETGLLEDEVSSILELRSGQVVLGHEGGLTFLDREYRTHRFGGTPSALSRVMDLEEDRFGNLWVAADRRGLARLTPRGQMRWFGKDNGLTGGIFALHLDPDGTVWVGTALGLFRQVGNRFELVPLPLPVGPSPPLIRRLVPGPDSSLYIATSHHGVFKYRAGSFTQYRPETGRAGQNTYTCFPLPNNGLYVGTAQGLFKVQNGALVRTSAPDPVIERPVYSILKDNHGLMWFGTDLGVMRWNGSHLDHLTTNDGILGNETNRDALIQTSDGNIWIGTDSGASEYNEIFDVPAKGIPTLQITGFMVNGNILPADDELVLSQPPHTLEILFDSFSFMDENQTRFLTQLENFEDQWHEIQAPRHGAESMNYINIPPGKYRFLVKAIRVDGVSSEVMVSPWITIKPSLLDRWIIRVFLVLLGLAMVWTVFAFLSGRRYAQRLENEVYQQTWELRLSENTIKSESRRLAATLKNITDGVLAVGNDGTIVLANAAAENILGLPQSEISGQQLESILPMGEHQSGEVLLRIDHPNRQDRMLEVSTSEVPDSDSKSEFSGQGRVVAFRDITDLLHQEDERIRSQKLESLGVFAGGLAHDFNNLLTVMLGNLSILETSTNIPTTDMQMLTLVREASERAQSLTRQLLTFARGGMPLLETAAIGQIVRQSVDFSLSGTNISCTMDLPENLWPVEVDPGQMHQVLANLVINAVQAMPDGGTINVTGRNIGSEDRRMVLVEVADKGTGISPDIINRIFDPYFTTKDLGSGLGLAMAYSIVTKHGGNITVDSKLGEGSVFRVFLKAK